MKTNQLLLIQASLSCPKNQFNKFGNYAYRSCEDILEAVKPLLYETKTTLTVSDEVVEVGWRIYIKATATLKDAETWEVIDSNTAYAREEETLKWMQASQISGATSSYARKYCLAWLLLLDSNDWVDADATNTHWKEVKEDKPRKTSKSEEHEVSDTSSNPNWRFLKATKSVNFMKACLDEDDFINKIRNKYEFGEVEERQLREAYKNAMWIAEESSDLPFND